MLFYDLICFDITYLCTFLTVLHIFHLEFEIVIPGIKLKMFPHDDLSSRDFYLCYVNRVLFIARGF